MASPKVFISHSSADEPLAREFAESLRSLGFGIWFDGWDIRPGDRWPDAMERGLRESDVMVLLVDPETATRPNTLFELRAAVGLGKRIVPIVSGDLDVSQLPELVRYRRFVLRGAPEDTARELASATGAADASERSS